MSREIVQNALDEGFASEALDGPKTMARIGEKLKAQHRVSKETLSQMEEAMELVKEGVAGDPVDMGQVQTLIGEDDHS